MKLELSKELAESLGYGEAGGEDAARVDLVLSAYAQGRLSAGRASELLEMTRREFETFCFERKLAQPFDEAELDREMRWTTG